MYYVIPAKAANAALAKKFIDLAIANVVGIDLNEAIMKKYGSGCPGCRQFVCTCDGAEKP